MIDKIFRALNAPLQQNLHFETRSKIRATKTKNQWTPTRTHTRRKPANRPCPGASSNTHASHGIHYRYYYRSTTTNHQQPPSMNNQQPPNNHHACNLSRPHSEHNRHAPLPRPSPGCPPSPLRSGDTLEKNNLRKKWEKTLKDRI